MKTRASLTSLLLLSSILFFWFISCTVTENEPPTVEITGWAVENIDETYWTKNGNDIGLSRAFFNMWVRADDPDGIDDIEYVSITNPEKVRWTLRDTSTGKDLYDEDGGFFGGWSRNHFPDDPYRVYLGVYTVLARDSAENEATDSISFSAPGSTTGSGFAYTEDYVGPTTGGVEMLKRATITDKTKGVSDITIEFQVDDSRVYNGWVWFYDFSVDYITWSGFFKNTINGGMGINVDGSTNTLVLQSSDFELGSFTWDDISGFHIILIDGEQYSPEEERYDYLSISSYELF